MNPAPNVTPQHHHLMPKRDIFCLKPALRLEWHDQNGNEAVERQHCALTLGGAGPKVATQAERAASFRRYVTRALHRRALVGYHWFEHADQPAEGRFDGDNSNFGTVTIEDRVYDELTRAMAAVNAEAEAMHSAAAAA